MNEKKCKLSESLNRVCVLNSKRSCDALGCVYPSECSFQFEQEKFYEGNEYRTSTGRITSLVPRFNETFTDNTRKFHSWLISESIAEAEHRNDWFNKIWLKGVKAIFEKNSKKDLLPEYQIKSLYRYTFDKAYIENKLYKRYLKRQAKKKEKP